MGWKESGITTILAGTLMLALISAYLYKRDRRIFLGLWALGWATSVGHYSFRLAIDVAGPRPILFFFCQMLSSTSALLLFLGALAFAEKRLHFGWLIGLVAVVLWMAITLQLDIAAHIITAPAVAFVGVVYIGAGVAYLGLKEMAGVPKNITGISFILVGLVRAGEPLQVNLSWLSTWNHRIAAGAGVFVALGMLLLYFEKIRMESELGEQRYRLLADNARDVIYRCRLFPALAVEYVSPSVEQLTGYSNDEFYNNPAIWQRVVHQDELALIGEFIGSFIGQPDGDDEKTNPFSELMATLEHGNQPGGLFPLKLCHKDGKSIPTEQQIVLVSSENGQFIGVEGICRDITERVQATEEQERLSEQLVHAQKMEALGSLAGGIAHDMNNVLASIMGVASLLDRRLRTDAKSHRYMETILSSCKRGRDLTRNLLGFARKGMMRKDKISLNQVADNVANLLRLTLPKGIAVRTTLEPALAAVEGDPGHLEQLLMNLCINAADAIGKSGTIRVITANKSLGPDDLIAEPKIARGDFVRLQVVDDGEGMKRETRERVFEPFFTTKETGKGTGLGLSMVYGTAASHGGFVEIESEKGKGTCVTLYFPALDVPAEQVVAPAPISDLRLGGRTVLLVDDEEMIRTTGMEMLEELDFTVIVADSGEQALQIFSDKRDGIALVILDLAMPGMDGATTYHELRKIDPDVPILFATAYARDSFPGHLRADEIGDLIQKPFTLEELAIAVGRVFDRRSSSPPSPVGNKTKDRV